MDSRGEGLLLSASSGNDPAAAPAEAYGPIELRRYVKSDGRALILFTDDGLERDDPADAGAADDGPTQDRPPRG